MSRFLRFYEAISHNGHTDVQGMMFQSIYKRRCGAQGRRRSAGGCHAPSHAADTKQNASGTPSGTKGGPLLSGRVPCPRYSVYRRRLRWHHQLRRGAGAELLVKSMVGGEFLGWQPSAVRELPTRGAPGSGHQLAWGWCDAGERWGEGRGAPAPATRRCPAVQQACCPWVALSSEWCRGAGCRAGGGPGGLHS